LLNVCNMLQELKITKSFEQEGGSDASRE